MFNSQFLYDSYTNKMKMSNNKIVIGVSAIVVLIVVFFIGRYSVSNNGAQPTVVNVTAADMDGIPAAQFAPFWKVWSLLDQKYVSAASTTPQEKIYGAIQGLAASEGDPYTVFFPPQQSALFQSDIKGDFEGVGMEIDIKNGRLTVISPLKDSPAAKAGIATGDIVTKIDDQDTTNMTVGKAVGFIRGPKGSTVSLTVVRSPNPQPFVIKVVRDVISIPTLETSVKGTGANSIFIIHLYTFTATSPNLFRDALRTFVSSGSHKLILDLRGNPGGYLDAAWDMASWFLPAGDVVVTEDYGGKAPNQVYRSKGYNIFNKNLQMEILVDGGSASASEILSAALKDHGVATIIGTKTFGKGSVQELIPITADTSLKVTVARWLTPNGHNLSHDGIDPDVVVAQATSSPAIAGAAATATGTTVATSTDAVMLKAVSLLQTQP